MSNKYPEYKTLDLPNVAAEVLKRWDAGNTFEKSVSTREGAQPFVFFEGPPSANGMPGIHHVMSRAIKDIFCRYKTLKGFRVERKAGWDTHGLPIELGVEKELGITKEDIGKKITVDEYNQACRKAVMKYTDKWEELTRMMGYWVDMKHPYVTYENKYIESVWWLLKRIYDKNLLYTGYTIQPYSPAAGTGLSSHELNQPGTYKNVKDKSAIAMFRLDEGSKTKVEHLVGGKWDLPTYMLAWTTTPWTLPANTALAVGKEIEYVVVWTVNSYSQTKGVVIVARDLFETHFNSRSEFISDEEKAKLEALKTPIEKLDFLNEIGKLPKALLDKDGYIETDSPEKIAERSKSKTEKLLKGGSKPGGAKIGTIKGFDLIDLKYEQLLPYAQPISSPLGGGGQERANAFKVIAGDFVTTEEGTGIVHIAPTFGADDMRVAKENGVPAMLVNDEFGKPVPLVDLRGRFRPEMKDDVFGFAGEPVKEAYLSEEEKKAETEKQKVKLSKANGGYIPDTSTLKYQSVDERIIKKLELDNKLFKKDNYDHNYPHCWRTDKPILYYPLDSWFIKIPEVRNRMAELNKTINWKPESTGIGRFGNWLESANDWNLSRSRYWGIPLPIWRSEDGEEKCIGSIEELKTECDKAVKAGVMKTHQLENFKPGDFSEKNYTSFDLHRPYVDDIILVSSKGKPMKRELDLIDVWFDSGSMPYAQWHYPFENKEKIEGSSPQGGGKERAWGTSFPADFIAEGVDQTRGWFYTLHAIGTLCFDSVAYKNVVSNGLVLDKNGQKMSKRLGNAADPFETLKTYGPDATRWYMITNAQPWDNLKFDLEGIAEVQRKFFRALHNTYAFFALYANIDGFTYKEKDVAIEKRPEIDRWIISKLNTLVKTVDEAYANYEPTQAGRAIQDFVVDHLSNWYVRLCRRRFWKGDYTEDKIAAYQTLYTCLETVAVLSAPVAPFYSDQLFTDLNTASKKFTDSVHLAHFPKVNEKEIDLDLEARMDLAQKISSMVLSLRKKENIRVRQPLSRIMIPVLNDTFEKRVKAVEQLILAEVNIKEISYLKGNDAAQLVKTIKPNFKTLGPKYGNLMKEIAGKVNTFSQADIQKLEAEGKYDINIGTNAIALTLEDVEIRSQDIPGWTVQSEHGITVALDITITAELKQEGIARELVNRIQTLRKETGLDVTDKIALEVKRHESINEAVLNNLEYICAETLAVSLQLVDNQKDMSHEVEVEEGIKTYLRLIKT
jgi:isoleucyl-tRNA synthetase